MKAMTCFADVMENRPHLRRPLLDFVGVGDAQVPRWRAGNGPLGYNLLRLRIFLREVGYEVEGVSSLPAEVFDLARIISFRVLTEAEALKLIGVAEGSLLRILLAKSGASQDNLAKIREVVEAYKPELDAKLASAPWAKEETRQKQPEKPPSSAVPKAAGRDRDGVGISSHLVMALLPLAELLVSDAHSAEDRRKLRKLCGDDGIFRLSTALNCLCSEDARERYGKHLMQA